MAAENRPKFKAVLSMTVFVGALAATVYFALTYTGPYRWLAELQLVHGHSYNVQLVFGVTWLILAGPPLAAIALCSWFMGLLQPQEPPQDWGRDPHDDSRWNGSRTADVEPVAQDTRPQAGSIWNAFKFVAPSFALFMWVLGGLSWYNYSTSTNVAQVSIEDWEAGHGPQAHWVNVHGRALAEAAIKYGDRSQRDVYVPVVSRAWRPGQPAKVFLMILSDTAASRNWVLADSHTGTIKWLGLPGPVRYAFEQSGIPPAADYAMIMIGPTPARSREGAFVGAGVGAIVMAVYCVALVIHGMAADRADSTAPVTR